MGVTENCVKNTKNTLYHLTPLAFIIEVRCFNISLKVVRGLKIWLLAINRLIYQTGIQLFDSRQSVNVYLFGDNACRAHSGYRVHFEEI